MYRFTKYRYFLWLLLVTPLFALGQSNSTVVYGTIRDAKTNTTLPGAAVEVISTRAGGTSDRQGNYAVRVSKKRAATIRFSFVGQESQEKRLSLQQLASASTDSIRLDISLLIAPGVIDTMVISGGHQEPDTIYGNHNYHVADFAFVDDKILFLLYEKRLEKGARVMLTDEREKELGSLLIPGEVKELFQDFLGNVHVITKTKAFQILIESYGLDLAPMDIEKFNSTIRPGIDTLENKILFSDYRWYRPEFHYYSYAAKDSSVSAFKHIVDKPMARMYDFEYYFLEPRQKLEARQLAAVTGLTKHDVAAIMTDFQNTMFYEAPYAPLFVVDDTVMVFDHHSDLIFKYNRKMDLIDSVAIDYHESKLHKGWKRMLLKDEADGTVHALYQKHGYFFLKGIDTMKGCIVGTTKLSYKYAEKIRIKKGYVYYIFRPHGSLQNRFLYRERLEKNQ